MRYGNDLLIYANSCAELAATVVCLCEELARVGLNLNASKTKIFTTGNNGAPVYVDMCGDLMQVLGSGDWHRYLGKSIPGVLRKRGQADVNNRIQSVLAAFHRHRSVLTNTHVSLKSQLELLASTVTLTVKFSPKACPCTVIHLKQIDSVSAQMLGIVVSWIRVPSEDWAETMRRLRGRVQKAFDICKM